MTRTWRAGDPAGSPTGRAPLRAGTLATALMALAALLAACGGPASVGLAELARDQRTYDGQRIVVQGVVVAFGEGSGAQVPQHAALQDPASNRVELVPFEDAQPYVGSAVQVTGRFEFDPNRGRLLHIESIEAAGN